MNILPNMQKSGRRNDGFRTIISDSGRGKSIGDFP